MTALATMDQLKAALNVRQGEFDEATAQLFLDAASEQVERYCERSFRPDPAPVDEGEPAPAAVTREVRAHGRRMVRIPDARRLDRVTADGTLLRADQWDLLRIGDDPAPALHLDVDAKRLELTGFFGWENPPAPVVTAVLTLAARFYHERDARFADQTVDPMGGITNYFRQLPASVLAQISLYRIPGV